MDLFSSLSLGQLDFTEAVFARKSMDILQWSFPVDSLSKAIHSRCNHVHSFYLIRTVK